MSKQQTEQLSDRWPLKSLPGSSASISREWGSFLPMLGVLAHTHPKNAHQLLRIRMLDADKREHSRAVWTYFQNPWCKNDLNQGQENTNRTRTAGSGNLLCFSLHAAVQMPSALLCCTAPHLDPKAAILSASIHTEGSALMLGSINLSWNMKCCKAFIG